MDPASDDEPVVLLVSHESRGEFCPLEDYRVVRVPTAEDATRQLSDIHAVCVVLDHRDVDTDAIGVVRAHAPALPVLSVVAEVTSERVSTVLDNGATDYATADGTVGIEHRIRRTIDHRDARLLESALSDLFVDFDDLLYFKDEDSRFIRVSESMAEYRDLSREELRGMTDFDVMSEEEARMRYEDEQRIMETGEVTEDPNEQLFMPEGNVEWYHSKKAPMYDEDGDVFGTVGISREVTELKELDQTLAELEAIIDRVPVSLLTVDHEGTITWANRAAGELLAPPEDSLVGQNLSTLAADGPLNETFMEQYGTAFDELLSGPSDEDALVINDVVIRPGDGDSRICDVHVRLLPLAEDTFRGTAIAFHDVTEQVEQERVLSRQYDRLERLVETISHDLRSPLAVAIGKIEIAGENSEDDNLQDATRALKRIETLVEDLLTMARLGRSVENPSTITIDDVATQAWQPFESEPASLIVESDTTVGADPDRLLRLFENLFRNAIEHSPEGVTIRVGSTEEGFFVADDGYGIAPEMRDRVFSHGFSTEDDGHGLGLSIVQEVTSAHGWSIDVGESESGGARFDVHTTA